MGKVPTITVTVIGIVTVTVIGIVTVTVTQRNAYGGCDLNRPNVLLDDRYDTVAVYECWYSWLDLLTISNNS